MAAWHPLDKNFVEALHLTQRPVAVTFLDAVPAEFRGSMGRNHRAVVSGGWQQAAKCFIRCRRTISTARWVRTRTTSRSRRNAKQKPCRRCN